MSNFSLRDLYFKYLDSPNSNEEFEVKFGTKKNGFIQRDSFDDVIKVIKSKGFVLTNTEVMLRANSIYVDKTGRSHISRNVRTTILGAENIQRFCRSNTIIDENSDLRSGIYFERKQPKTIDDKRAVADVDDFNFRATYHEEERLDTKYGIAKDIIDNWNTTKKVFRYVKRFVFTKYDVDHGHLEIHMSITKNGSRKPGKGITPVYTVQESNVFNMPMNYEIEIEVYKNRVIRSNDELYYKNFHRVIMNILSGLQQTSYPVSFNKLDSIGQEYYAVVNKQLLRGPVKPGHFIGPSSISLEMKHIVPSDVKSSDVNIRKNYVVTDKADGMRKLLYVSSKGDIYMIDTNMKIQYTGCKTSNEDLYYTILDGEHITHDKMGNYLNVYAAFDVYFIKKIDHRTKEFHSGNKTDAVPESYRYNLLIDVVKELDMKSITSKNNFKVISKDFVYGSEETTGDVQSIFEASRQVLEKVTQYETDGLIYTPIHLGVGMMMSDKEPKNKKITWNASLKWKPPQFNTIDFLATTVKENGKDVIHTKQVDGSIVKYKTFILRVGYNKKFHGYINPCAQIINDQVPTAHDDEKDNADSYEPVPFYPMSPPDPHAHICNVIVDDSENAPIEDKSEVITDGTIIECKYEASRPEDWRFIPIRIRHDKTAQYQNNIKNYGNAFHVAQSVWASIHNPISEHMISTGDEISSDEVQISDIYYSRNSEKSYTIPMRNFHNLYVKRKLITSVSKPENTLIDLAVGKAGDMSKWIDSKLKFVFGVDVAKDNIENRLDGACARYLSKKAESYRMFDALFIQGNSSQNLRDGTGIENEQYKKIMNAVYGKGPKDEAVLGRGVYKKYGIVEEGFNIVSCQFALHYFFESLDTLMNFITNVSQNCKLGGYFIGTCYDGQKVFQALKRLDMGQKVSKFIKGKKVFEITKQYNSKEFPRNSSSLGMGIDVYQETINNVFREYLVNFDYFKDVMELFGFDVISIDEARKIGMPSGINNFKVLYDSMKNEIKHEMSASSQRRSRTKGIVKNAINMDKTPELEFISYLNNYFVFVKNRNIDPLTITRQSLGMKDIPDIPGDGSSEPPQITVEEGTGPKPIMKIKKRVVKKGMKLGKIKIKKKT
jgi:hypothetical protein